MMKTAEKPRHNGRTPDCSTAVNIYRSQRTREFIIVMREVFF